MLTAGVLSGCYSNAEEIPDPHSELAALLNDHFSSQGITGVSTVLLKDDQVLWTYNYGHADRSNGMAMTADHIQNIGSISKTITATAIMQLWEDGRFQLDDDVNQYIPISIRNPRFPDIPITFRQLLTHRSSINDGPSYDASYACGDPAVSLTDWIEGYFTPAGAYYDGEANFHLWEPGTIDPPREPRAYTNVGFGLLGYLVEKIAGQRFNAYCKEHIFDPLGMHSTGWHIADIDRTKHSIPYLRLGDAPELPEDFVPADMLLSENVTVEDMVPNGAIPHCLYSFYNYPDGLVRTSANELSRFLRAYTMGGALEGNRILKADTISTMLSEDHFNRGLCWDTYNLENDEPFWGHDGGDPGVATIMAFRKRDRVGVVMLFNQADFGEGIGGILGKIIQSA